jgi:hypothetical protein
MVKNFIKENTLLKAAFLVLPLLASTSHVAQAMDHTPVKKTTRKPTPRPTPDKPENPAKVLRAEAKELKKNLPLRRRGLSAPEKPVTHPMVENVAPQTHKDDAALPCSLTHRSVKLPLSTRNSGDEYLQTK